MAPKLLPVRAVLPVIHPQSLGQTLRNVQVSIDAGAVGAFIINNDIDPYSAIPIFGHVREQFSGFWLGVNLLGLGSLEGIVVASGLGADGYQSDNAHICEDDSSPTTAEITYAIKQKRAPGMLYFGGVDFKGQPSHGILEDVTQAAAMLMDVVTTSGPATGLPPPIEKIRLMRRVLGSYRRLALASGVSIDNIDTYLPYASYFLVGSSITLDWENLDLGLTSELVERVNNYSPPE